MKKHHYSSKIKWTGNAGSGTSGYRNYSRNHQIIIDGKPMLEASSDPHFRGNAQCHNPEDLFLASLSSCHMLWYLHLCADAGVVVTAYEDQAIGTLSLDENGSGQFTEVVLTPEVIVAQSSMIQKAQQLHGQANKMCFIANSCNFPIEHDPTCKSQA